jgi:hypothetical protein
MRILTFSRFGIFAGVWDTSNMSNREIVIDLLSRLPEDVTLEEIAREIELLAGIKIARDQARRGEGIPADDARKLIDTWAGQ